MSVVEPFPGDQTALNPTFSGAVQRTGVLMPVVPPRQFSANLSSSRTNFYSVKSREVRREHTCLIFPHSVMTSPTRSRTKVATTMLIQAVRVLKKRAYEPLLHKQSFFPSRKILKDLNLVFVEIPNPLVSNGRP